MMISNSRLRKNENGAVAIYTALVLTVLVMFAAFGVDVNYLYGVRNELQNAADAGALAGASVLFNSNGSLNRDAALIEGDRVAVANKTGDQAVVVEIIETGHWSFADKEFTENSNTEQTDWKDKSFDDLDSDGDFINAVRVSTKRDDTPSFFAKIFFIDNFFISAEAVAYVVPPEPLYFDLPIAICEEPILLDPSPPKTYDCNMGRMLNSGGDPSTEMTAMWTDFSQDNPRDEDQNSCDTANSATMKNITEGCNTNIKNVVLGLGVGTVNGVQDVVLGNVYDCWLNRAADTDEDTIPDQFWSVTLPVIECGVDNTCSPLVGAVEVNIIWIQYKNDSWTQMKEVPTYYNEDYHDDNGVLQDAPWECSESDTLEERQQCWMDFVDAFRLGNVNGTPQSTAEYEEMYQKKNIFFLPQCEELDGLSVAGETEIPKLVQ